MVVVQAHDYTLYILYNLQRIVSWNHRHTLTVRFSARLWCVTDRNWTSREYSVVGNNSCCVIQWSYHNGCTHKASGKRQFTKPIFAFCDLHSNTTPPPSYPIPFPLFLPYLHIGGIRMVILTRFLWRDSSIPFFLLVFIFF